MTAKIAKTLQRLIMLIFTVQTMILLIAALFRQYEKGPLIKRLIRQQGPAPYYIMLMMASLLLFLLIRTLFSVADRLSEAAAKKAAVCLFLLMAGIFLLLLTQFRVNPVTDSWAIIDQAAYLAENGISKLQPGDVYFGYFRKYGNNYFLTFCLAVLLKCFRKLGMTDYLLPLYIINIAAVMAALAMGVLCVRKYAGIRQALKAQLLFTLNPATYFIVFWVYSCSVSIPLMTGSLLACLKLRHSDGRSRWLWGVLLGIILAMSFLIRPTSMIPVIAFGIIAFLDCLAGKLSIRHFFVSCIVVTALFVLVMLSARKLTDRCFAEAKPYNFPLTHWLMMGSHGDGQYFGGDEVTTASFETKEEKLDYTVKQTLSNYRELGLAGTAKLWIRKMTDTFSDGWAQCSARLTEDTRFTPLYQWLAGDTKDIPAIYFQAFRIVTLLLMLAAAWRMRGGEYRELSLLCALTVTGGILFYCLWESKSVYSVPFIPVMLMLIGAESGSPVCASGEEKLYSASPGRVSGLGSPAVLSRFHSPTVLSRLHRSPAILAALLLCFSGIILGIRWYPVFCRDDFRKTEYSVRCWSWPFRRIIRADDDGNLLIRQAFFAEKPFDSLRLFAGRRVDIETGDTYTGEQPADEVSRYRLRILAADETCLYETELTPNDFSSDDQRITLPRITPEGRTGYVLEIEKTENKKYVLSFLHRISLAMDQYDGTATVNGEKQQYDLYMSVFEMHKAPYMPPAVYIALILLCLAGTSAMLLYLNGSARNISDAVSERICPDAARNGTTQT